MQHPMSLLVFRKPDIYSPFPEAQLYVPVAHLRIFFQKERQGTGDERRCHAGAAFGSILTCTVGAAGDGCAWCHDVRLADAGSGGTAPGVINHPAAHDINLFVIVGASYGDYLAADARCCDGAAFGSHISCRDHNYQPVIPGFVDAPDQNGIFTSL